MLTIPTCGTDLNMHSLYFDVILNTIGLGFVVIEVLIELPFFIGIILGEANFANYSSNGGQDCRRGINRLAGFNYKRREGHIDYTNST